MNHSNSLHVGTVQQSQLLTRRWATLGAVLVVVALGAWLILPNVLRQHFDFDYRQFGSVAELGSEADAVVVGTVTGVLGRFTDRGGDPEVDEHGDPIPGIPMVVYSVEVSDQLVGDAAATVPVAMIDLDKANVSGVSDIDTGEPVVLFLVRRTTATAPDIASVADVVWVPLSGDYGIFDVAGDMAMPRVEGIALTDDDEPRPEFPISEIADALA